jgi:hypothetical protein
MKNVSISHVLGFDMIKKLLPFLVLILSLKSIGAVTLVPQSPFLIFIERGTAVTPIQSLCEELLVDNGIWGIQKYSPEKNTVILEQANRSKIELVIFIKPADSAPPILVSGPDVRSRFLGKAELSFARKLRGQLLQTLEEHQGIDLGYIPYREVTHLSSPYLVLQISPQEDLGSFSSLLTRFLADTFPGRFILKKDVETSNDFSPFAVTTNKQSQDNPLKTPANNSDPSAKVRTPNQALVSVPDLEQLPIFSEKAPLRSMPPIQELVPRNDSPMQAPSYLVASKKPKPTSIQTPLVSSEAESIPLNENISSFPPLKNLQDTPNKKEVPQFFNFLITAPPSKPSPFRSIGFGSLPKQTILSSQSTHTTTRTSSFSSLALSTAIYLPLSHQPRLLSTGLLQSTNIHLSPRASQPAIKTASSVTVHLPQPRVPSFIALPSKPASTPSTSTLELLSEVQKSASAVPDPVPFWLEE